MNTAMNAKKMGINSIRLSVKIKTVLSSAFAGRQETLHIIIYSDSARAHYVTQLRNPTVSLSSSATGLRFERARITVSFVFEITSLDLSRSDCLCALLTVNVQFLFLFMIVSVGFAILRQIKKKSRKNINSDRIKIVRNDLF